MRNESPAIVVRVTPELKAELAAVTKTHRRSLSGETRAAVDVWLAVNRRPEEPSRRAPFWPSVNERERAWMPRGENLKRDANAKTRARGGRAATLRPAQSGLSARATQGRRDRSHGSLEAVAPAVLECSRCGLGAVPSEREPAYEGNFAPPQ